MKTCPNCHELNGENCTECWKCHTPFPYHVSTTTYIAQDPHYKRCPRCGYTFSKNAKNCDSCGGRLVDCFDERPPQYNRVSSSSGDGCWLYGVSFLVPLVGFILGGIYISKGDNDMGRNMIIAGIVSMVLCFIIAFMFSFCSVSRYY